MFFKCKNLLLIFLYFFSFCYQNFIHCENMVLQRDPISDSEMDDLFKFNNFYKVLIQEQYLNDQNICDRCKLTTQIHETYDQQNINPFEKCYGNFKDCTVDVEPINRRQIINSLKAALSIYDEDELIDFIDKNIHNVNETISKKAYDLQQSCGTCSCYCAATRPRDGSALTETIVDSICLDPISADISQQYAISGIRFVKSFKSLVLEAKVGKIISASMISAFPPPQWKAADRCKHLEIIDHKNATFILDDISLPEDHVITDVVIRKCDERWTHNGVTIRTIRNCNGNFFYLSAYGTAIDNIAENITNDFVEGTRSGPLSLSQRTILTNDNMIPRVDGQIKKLSTPGKNYIKFQTTSWQMDKAKNIVPQIDTRPIIPEPGRPLVGIGLDYYGDTASNGASKFGGYLSLKATVYVE